MERLPLWKDNHLINPCKMKEKTTGRIFRVLTLLILAASLVVLFALAKSAVDVLVPLTFWIIILTCSLLLLFLAANAKRGMIRMPMKRSPGDDQQVRLVRQMLGWLAVVVAVMDLALCLAWHLASAAFTIASTIVVVLAMAAVVLVFAWKIRKDFRKNS